MTDTYTDEIELGQEGGGGSWVLKRHNIGEYFVGGIVNFEPRNILDDDGNPIPKKRDDGEVMTNRNGDPLYRKEMVVTLLALEGTMTAGLGEDGGVPEPATLVRDILKGGGYSSWIDAENGFKTKAGRRVRVGDLYATRVTEAQRYKGTPGNIKKVGDVITDPAVLVDYRENNEAYKMRQETVGVYGDAGIKEASTPEELAFKELCKAEHLKMKAAPEVELGTPPRSDNPFPDRPSTPAAAAPGATAGFFSS